MTPALEDAVVIETLALSEARLMDCVVDLTIESDSYRRLAQQAIHALHDVIEERDHLRERNRELRAEIRRYTAKSTVGKQVAA